jgi:hypothetical protein
VRNLHDVVPSTDQYQRGNRDVVTQNIHKLHVLAPDSILVCRKQLGVTTFALCHSRVNEPFYSTVGIEVLGEVNELANYTLGHT